MNKLKWLLSYIKSKTLKEDVNSLTENAIGVCMKDPVAAFKLVKQIRFLPLRIKDGIYWEHFETYLYHLYDYDKETNIFVDKNKKKLSVMLAEDIPNNEAGYSGNSNRLRENIKRIIKLLDDAGTSQKAVYYANLTRAALNDFITRDKFFKLCKCVTELTEEDIDLFIIHIQMIGTTTIKDDKDFIDDFRSLGLLKEVNGGFAYTNRAFELLKFGFKYEEKVNIPEDIQKRIMISPARLGGIEDIIKIENDYITIKKDNQIDNS